jgi:hypothetical protein
MRSNTPKVDDAIVSSVCDLFTVRAGGSNVNVNGRMGGWMVFDSEDGDRGGDACFVCAVLCCRLAPQASKPTGVCLLREEGA